MTTKLYLAITPNLQIIDCFLTDGNTDDISIAGALTAYISGCYVIEDKEYDCNNHRQNLLSNNNIPVIPGRKNRKEAILYDKTKYKLRLLIENFFAKLNKENSGLSMRFDKLDSAFLAFIAFAAIKLYLVLQLFIYFLNQSWS